jgi:hypothetical protein
MKRLAICIIVILIIGITITADTQRKNLSNNSEEKTLAVIVESNSPSKLQRELEKVIHEVVLLLIQDENIENLNVIDTNTNIFNQEWDYLSVINMQVLDENNIILCSRIYFRTIDVSEADRKLIQSQTVPSTATIYANKGTMKAMHYRATSPENALLKIENVVEDIVKIMKGLSD